MHNLDCCPVCGSRNWRQSYIGQTTRNPDDEARWSVAHCSACDHGFLNPQPTWAELDQYYNSNYQPYDSTHGLTESLESTIATARETGTYNHVAIRPGLRLLDVGAGGGAFLTVARALGAVVKGVEPSSFGVSAARKNGLDVFEGTLEQYVASGAAERFDLVTFSHVIEHLPNPIETLKLASTLLADNGRIWLAIPNGACASSRKLQWRWHSADLPIHLHHFSPQSLKVAAEKAGLLIQSLSTYSLPAAVRSSTLLEWRHRWMVPQKIGGMILSQGYVDNKAKCMDADGIGEAIIAELGQPVTSRPLMNTESKTTSRQDTQNPVQDLLSAV